MLLRVLKPEEQELEAIKKTLGDLAEYYSLKLSDKQIDMYAEDLVDMGSENVTRSISAYRKDWNSKTFPLPSQLRKQIFFSNSQKVAYA